MDVKSACPLCPGLHTYYNATDKGQPTSDGELIPETVAQFNCSLQLENMKAESLVIAGQHTAVNPFRALYTPPSHHGSWSRPKSLP